MKYAIVIPDGCADEAQPSLGGKTPLQAARKPHMDKIAQAGLVGRTDNGPPRRPPPAAVLPPWRLFRYDPLVVYTGRAPLETAAMGLTLGPGDWAIRCNLVHVENEQMRDFTAGHITPEEGKALIAAIQAKLGGGALEFHAGVSYGNILIYRAGSPSPSGRGVAGRWGEGAPFSADTKTQPPHDIPDQLIAGYLPKGAGAALLCDLMQKSRDVLRDHPVNQARRAAGKRDATQIWLWGQGRAPRLTPFTDLYHKKGAIISAVDLVRG